MWACPACTYENAADVLQCTICETARVGGVDEDPFPSSRTAQQPQRFCGHCGAACAPGDAFCTVCGSPPFPSSSQPAAPLQPPVANSTAAAAADRLVVTIPPGVHAGMPFLVHTPQGSLASCTVPNGWRPGMRMEIAVPRAALPAAPPAAPPTRGTVPPPPSSAAAASQSLAWACPVCTLDNLSTAVVCAACASPRPSLPSSEAEQVAMAIAASLGDGGGGRSSGGSGGGHGRGAGDGGGLAGGGRGGGGGLAMAERAEAEALRVSAAEAEVRLRAQVGPSAMRIAGDIRGTASTLVGLSAEDELELAMLKSRVAADEPTMAATGSMAATHGVHGGRGAPPSCTAAAAFAPPHAHDGARALGREASARASEAEEAAKGKKSEGGLLRRLVGSGAGGRGPSSKGLKASLLGSEAMAPLQMAPLQIAPMVAAPLQLPSHPTSLPPHAGATAASCYQPPAVSNPPPEPAPPVIPGAMAVADRSTAEFSAPEPSAAAHRSRAAAAAGAAVVAASAASAAAAAAGAPERVEALIDEPLVVALVPREQADGASAAAEEAREWDDADLPLAAPTVLTAHTTHHTAPHAAPLITFDIGDAGDAADTTAGGSAGSCITVPLMLPAGGAGVCNSGAITDALGGGATH